MIWVNRSVTPIAAEARGLSFSPYPNKQTAALIGHGKFSSAPVLKVTSPGISRSRRQLAGL